jgi:hypothetical protein
MIRVVANGTVVEFNATEPNDWELAPCWECNCTLYWWDDRERMSVRLQHGPNPEAQRAFAATPSRFGGLSVSQTELLAWLRRVHAYEDTGPATK